MADDPIIIRNPGRRLVAAGTALAILLMFLPPLLLGAVHFAEPMKAVVGSVILLLVAGWFARSAWTVPIEARIGARTLTLRSAKESHYELSQIRRWFFAVPRGLPTQSPPPTNALLVVLLEDGVKFRGEVTSQEAALLAQRLPHVAIANAITD